MSLELHREMNWLLLSPSSPIKYGLGVGSCLLDVCFIESEGRLGKGNDFGLSRYLKESLVCLGNTNKHNNNDNSSNYGGFACLSTA